MKTENPYCSFKVATDKLAAKVENFKKQDELFPKALDFAQNGRLQEAAIILEHLLKQKPNDEDILALTGFVHFFIGNYPKAKEVNETILKQSPTHSYANKGLGLTLHKMGETREGIKFIEKAIEYATDDFLDPYYDLATVYQEIGDLNKTNEIMSVISLKKNRQ
jgi:tetratricopeptide (TPR) repeat protein